MSSSAYKLPCDCGEVTVVQKTQAGQTVDCQSCGTPLEVPTMRGLQQLEPHEDPEEEVDGDTPEASTGCFFSASLAVGSLFGVAAIALYLLALFWQPDMTIDSVLRDVDRQINEMETEQLLIVWDDIDKAGLGEAIPPHFVVYARQAAKLRMASYVCGVIGGIALLLSFIMFVRDFWR